MLVSLFRLTIGVAVLGLTISTSYAQSGTTRTALSGTVQDSGGGLLPGATVEVKNNRTGVVTPTVTNATGVFDVPAIDAGVYTITVSLSGFKTAVLTDVELLSGDAARAQGHARSGHADRVGRSTEWRAARTDAVDGDLVDHPRRSDLEPAVHHAQRRLNVVVFLPGVDTSAANHAPALVHGERAAAERALDHRRRRQHPGQVHALDRRVLRQHPSEARSDRGSHGVDRDGDGRQLRPGRGADQVRDPLGHQHVRGQRLRVLPAPRI